MTVISKLASKVLTWMKGASAGASLSFFLNLEPVPASRPRVSRWGTYYTTTYERWRKQAQPIADGFDGIPTDKPVVVLIETVCTKPKTGKLLYPRPDVDNFAKAPLDVMTKSKKFWKDDTQVVGLSVFKRYAEPGEEAGMYISWITLEN